MKGIGKLELLDPRRSRIVTRGTGELDNCHHEDGRQKNQLNRQMGNSRLTRPILRLNDEKLWQLYVKRFRL